MAFTVHRRSHSQCFFSVISTNSIAVNKLQGKFNDVWVDSSDGEEKEIITEPKKRPAREGGKRAAPRSSRKKAKDDCSEDSDLPNKPIKRAGREGGKRATRRSRRKKAKVDSSDESSPSSNGHQQESGPSTPKAPPMYECITPASGRRSLRATTRESSQKVIFDLQFFILVQSGSNSISA